MDTSRMWVSTETPSSNPPARRLSLCSARITQYHAIPMKDESNSAVPHPSIFPLPLSPFEQFTLRDDRRDYPMTFFFHWLVTGRVDRDALEQALADGLRRHPLLNCRIETQGREQVWVLSDDEKPNLKIVQPDAPLWGPREDFIDLSVETGLRVWVIRRCNCCASTFSIMPTIRPSSKHTRSPGCASR